MGLIEATMMAPVSKAMNMIIVLLVLPVVVDPTNGIALKLFYRKESIPFNIYYLPTQQVLVGFFSYEEKATTAMIASLFQ
jgi:hypothetical protein